MKISLKFYLAFYRKYVKIKNKNIQPKCIIIPEDQDKVWQRFWQADPSRGEDGGSGLGLAMVKEIVQLHGGSVSLESAPGKGSIFSVTL